MQRRRTGVEISPAPGKKTSKACSSCAAPESGWRLADRREEHREELTGGDQENHEDGQRHREVLAAELKELVREIAGARVDAGKRGERDLGDDVADPVDRIENDLVPDAIGAECLGAEEEADDLVTDVVVEVLEVLAAGALEAERQHRARTFEPELAARSPRVSDEHADAGDGDASERPGDKAPDRLAHRGERDLDDAIARVRERANDGDLLEAKLAAKQGRGHEVDVLVEQLRAVRDQHPADDRLTLDRADQRTEAEEDDECSGRDEDVQPEHRRDRVLVERLAPDEDRAEAGLGDEIEEVEQRDSEGRSAELAGTDPLPHQDRERARVEDGDDRAGSADPGDRPRHRALMGGGLVLVLRRRSAARRVVGRWNRRAHETACRTSR